MIEIVDKQGKRAGSRESWIYDSLHDLWILCHDVLSFQKDIEYQDLNWVHKALCDFIDPNKQAYRQLLVLMGRDMLKSSIGRGMMIQWLLNKAYYGMSGEAFIYCGILDLAKQHLEKIVDEILYNELIQSLFHGKIPAKVSDQRFKCRIDEGEIVWRGNIRIATGSPEKPISGRHFELGMVDNLNNEVNTRTVEMRKSINRSWQTLESVFIEKSREVVFETTWAIDDVSGIILDPESKFDYSKIKRKPCHVFMSNIGYKVFSCPATMGEGEIGTPVFPEKIDLEYLERKRRKQGYYLYSRLYELQPMADEEVIIRPEWWNVHYERLPMPFIRNICVDAAGSTKKGSSYSGLSIGEWDAAGTLYLPCATKRKLSFKELEKWIVTEFDMSAEEGRPVTWVGIEKEKFGMDLKAQIESYRSDIVITLWDNRGIPREKRHEDLVPYYESRKILAGPGQVDYEDELRTYYKGKDSNVDIIDTIWGHFQLRLLPTKPKFPTPYEATKSQLDKEVEEFEKQSEGDMRDRIRIPRGIALRF